MKPAHDAEVAVAGGGPAGAAAAIVLARAGRRVLLVDAAAEGAFRVGEALPPAARPLLRELGVLDRFLADGHLRCHGNVSAWGSREARGTDFIRNPHGHGFHLDRARFDAMLRAAARAAGARVLGEARIADVDAIGPDGEEGFRLHIAGPEGPWTPAVAWLVEATGRPAAMARRLGAERLVDDALVAFYARFRAAREGDLDGRTLVEAVPDGWWYTARVPSGERVVACLTDVDLADRKRMLSPEGFTASAQATEHVSATLDAHGYALAERPRGIDAASARLDTFAGPGWIATGDAAISLDPLSSQGMLNGLYTGMLAGQALDAKLAGDGAVLARYLSRLEEIHRAYRQNRAIFYAEESRFQDRPFWKRRARAPWGS